MSKFPPVDYSTFDWMAFLDDLGIPYVARGKNVARGHVNIKCPLCGNDPSEHLGLNLTDSRWGCWRDPSHRGRKPNKLIESLLGIDWKEADTLARKYLRSGGAEITQITAKLKEVTQTGLLRKGKDTAPDVPFPKGSWPLSGARHKDVTLPAIQYMAKVRGFNVGLRTIVRRYGIRYVPRDAPSKIRDRIVVPVVQHQVIRGFVCRALSPEATIRYYAYPKGDDLKDTIWNYDKCLAHGGELPRGGRGGYRNTPFSKPRAGKFLVICEGVFDAMKLDFYGGPAGMRAVALLGLTLSDKKVSLLAKMARFYEKVFVCLDNGATVQTRQMVSKLTLCRAKPLWLPPGIKDPGDMTPEQVTDFSSSLK